MKEISKTNEIVFYQTENSDVIVNVVFKNETFWLTQKAMAELFDCSVDNISLHLRNIFNDLELDKDSVTEDFSITAADGKNYKTKCYNLDAIIAVGYRVNSKKATKFRQWATKTLREYITKGFVINDPADHERDQRVCPGHRQCRLRTGHSHSGRSGVPRDFQLALRDLLQYGTLRHDPGLCAGHLQYRAAEPVLFPVYPLVQTQNRNLTKNISFIFNIL